MDRKQTPRIRRAIGVLALGAVLISAEAGMATEPFSQTSESIQGEQRTALKNKLNLTEAQQAALEPIMAENAQKRASILRAYGISKDRKTNLNLRQKIELRDRMNDLSKKLNRDVSDILTKDQMKVFKKFQDDARERMRAELKQGRQK